MQLLTFYYIVIIDPNWVKLFHFFHFKTQCPIPPKQVFLHHKYIQNTILVELHENSLVLL